MMQKTLEETNRSIAEMNARFAKYDAEEQINDEMLRSAPEG